MIIRRWKEAEAGLYARPPSQTFELVKPRTPSEKRSGAEERYISSPGESEAVKCKKDQLSAFVKLRNSFVVDGRFQMYKKQRHSYSNHGYPNF